MKKQWMVVHLLGGIILISPVFGGEKQTRSTPIPAAKTATNPFGIVTRVQVPVQPTTKPPYEMRMTRTDMGQEQMKKVNLLPINQNPPAAMVPVDKAAQKKNAAAVPGLQGIRKRRKDGAYDGRWSRSGAGQLTGLEKTIHANKVGEQCPPEVLQSRPASEWQK